MSAQTHGFPELLELLGFGPDDAVTLCHQSPGGRFEARWTTTDKAPAVADDYPGEHAWFNVNGLRDGKDIGRGAVCDVTRLAAVYADLDVKVGGLATMKAATDVVDDIATLLGTKPAAIIMSGHGLQPLWTVDVEDGDAQLDDENRGRAVAVLRRFGRLVSHVAGTRGGRVDSVFDLARVLRVPGTVNVKDPAALVAVKVAVCEDSRPLSVAELDEVLDLYGALEQPGDRDQAGGEIVAPVAEWAWSASTHPAVVRAGASWSEAAPANRHPWLLGIATSLAFARRLGMVTEVDHGAAVEAVTARFRWLLAHQAPIRGESPGEIADCLSHGVNVAQRKSETDAVTDWAFWIDLVADLPVTALDDQQVEAFWSSRPILAHVHAFARARMCSPWAVLGVVLARVVVAVPPWYVLPPLVGSEASLNLFAALVGRSGGGKGAAEAAGADCLNVGHVEVATVGSGEGIGHLFAHREKAEVIRDRQAVLFTVPEVDNLVALGTRQGATLLPQLRSAWSGEKLGFSYADKNKALPIDRHTYRLGLLLGIQPGRAAPLLDDADGGTPQRFLWMPTTDPDAPDVTPECPPPLDWSMPPGAAYADHRGLRVVTVPPVARQTVEDARRAHLRGEGDALDGHGLLARLKVSAALAFLDGRSEITDEDWTLAGAVMAVSDATRAGVVRYLATKREDANRARGLAEADRAVVVSETVEAAAVRRAGQTILRHLGTHGDTPWSEARRRLTSGLRPHFEAAVDALVTAGAVVVETSERGQALRLSESTR